MDKGQFCRACGQFATGVIVATVLDADGEPHGMTVNSFTSVSLAPQLILICVDHSTQILDHFRNSRHFGLNMLSEGQRHLSEHFARKGRDRFDGVEWYAGESGVPLIAGVLATVECTQTRTLSVGDHDILIGQVLHAQVREGKPLIFFGSTYRRLE